jgi:hypothetical protein
MPPPELADLEACILPCAVLYDVLTYWYQVGLLAELEQNMLCLLLGGRVLHGVKGQVECRCRPAQSD